ncbi:hypothetical protein [Dyadobacter sp. CY351]|uniref:hypothetical protein n=1 Tax=Dyadobacter sp. CY351 TaxID=2909337 RepID=UPI001F1DCFAF|nr:hypothetical protein [Dyadobacter sp. CY351]MCF2516326.1 hypothetical protein [Dyadobacter sp. CY351]
MSFQFKNLTDETRELMKSEVSSDIQSKLLYYSKRFCEAGHLLYAELLVESIKKGNEQSLAAALKEKKCFADTEPRNTKKGIVP